MELLKPIRKKECVACGKDIHKQTKEDYEYRGNYCVQCGGGRGVSKLRKIYTCPTCGKECNSLHGMGVATCMRCFHNRERMSLQGDDTIQS